MTLSTERGALQRGAKCRSNSLRSVAVIAACMITPIPIIGPCIDLAVDDPIELNGGRVILGSCVNTEREATDNEPRQDQFLKRAHFL